MNECHIVCQGWAVWLILSALVILIIRDKIADYLERRRGKRSVHDERVHRKDGSEG